MVELHSFSSFECDFLVIDTPKVQDLILGFDFPNYSTSSIHCRKGLITFNPDHNNYNDPIQSFSNYFLSSDTCEAGVGDSRTPSFPSSVNIPSPSYPQLRANNLFAKASKCPIHYLSVEYLVHIVASEGLNLDQSNVQHIAKWPTQRSLKTLQPFLFCANFCSCFIKNHSKTISSLTKFLNEETHTQSHQLKEAFTTTPVLSHLNPSLPTIVETSSSDYSLGAVLSQVSDSGKNYIEFYSNKNIPEELNYEINDKELLGMVWALKC
ncbi:hypothetical protein O181_081272 [Austropuccinia psidii MF-1]|uniref:Reverse transcriptase/retrotransposon-derived protein RNase H-like domain-containing protein n=1 Tax=Austropuccinia psidii MF-1 TaxID=1389203 RepID=A0A9Q3II76_9BASI|nr:hypothetical protein [Austropuccinia psidii MF-1]